MSTGTGSKTAGKIFTVAVASGKGGTGKTTVAISMALCAETDVQLLDCDVEEPNAHILLKPSIQGNEHVSMPVPFLDEAKCTGCGKCSGICAFNAIVFLKKPLFLPDLCHSCGLCMKVCPGKAIMEKPRHIGILEIGAKGDVGFVSGCLDIGIASSPALIRAVRKQSKNAGLEIIDCPPGTACSFVTSVKDSDFVLLVTEPTRFGLHDMTLAIKVIKQLKLPFGVLVNKSISDDDCIGKYCSSEKIPLLMRIPDDRSIAEAYSRGVDLMEVKPELKDGFLKMIDAVRAIAEEDGGK
ncbi:MAG TPA: (4Fe-4S)-binding protein [Lentisphaeria bacterium]|nr:MAG: hypothetical protein A2X48_02470 [Lentisphaerae bacterium GWF2_49_21]HBC89801.1 (4Fe-4S)-binding protein [Lentisphaeria bacterium]